ncbi:RNA pseudouridylate synthase, putative [Plasmodium ovale]|uniref:RNA pseudouridylate synthase, putative n=2 Tax=Plasmodium ovale TaxID=36330 RepID=A0A1A8WSB1_PLAOA|nr:RNA pseudouridylate synthase, putative [Plasmodium ovale curtisi]SCQ17097.1 RNA pseudouridylate synthase, putative [Plasmodium ovale]
MFPAVQLRKTVFLRLSKILSLSCVASRSKAQELIRTGRVKVNNQSIVHNVPIDVSSEIEIDGKRIQVDTTTKLWGVYKPKNVFCSTDKDYQYEERKQFFISRNGQVCGKKTQLLGENERKSINTNCLTQYANKDRITCEKTLVFRGNNFPAKGGNIKRYTRGGEVTQQIPNSGKTTGIVAASTEAAFAEIATANPTTQRRIVLSASLFDFIRRRNKAQDQTQEGNNVPEHLIMVNSLSTSSEGIVLLTNDGDFADKLRDINNNILTTYLIKVQEELSDEKLKLLKKGCLLGDVHIRPLDVHIVKRNLPCKWLQLTYVEKSHTYLEMLFSKYNLTIKKCKRFSFGPYKSSDLANHFLMPLKIHSTIKHLLPKLTPKLTLSQPKGNIVMDSSSKYLQVKNYLDHSLLLEP